MAGWNLPGDPYIPPGWDNNNGWIEGEPEQPPVADAPPAEPKEEPEEEEDDESVEEESDEEEPAVEDPRHPIRNMGAPLPPPRHQVYRHPGGPLWKRTVRVSILTNIGVYKNSYGSLTCALKNSTIEVRVEPQRHGTKVIPLCSGTSKDQVQNKGGCNNCKVK